MGNSTSKIKKVASDSSSTSPSFPLDKGSQTENNFIDQKRLADAEELIENLRQQLVETRKQLLVQPTETSTELEEIKTLFKKFRAKAHRANVANSARIFDLELQLNQAKESLEASQETSKLEKDLDTKNELIKDMSVRLLALSEEIERLRRCRKTGREMREVKDIHSTLLARAAK